MPRILYISPMVPSTDVAGTAQFLERALGFTTKFYGDYAICERDGLSLHLLPAGTDVGEQSIYIEVDDVDAMWPAMQPHVTAIRHKPPHDRDYHMREIHTDLPHTRAMLFVGQCI